MIQIETHSDDTVEISGVEDDSGIDTCAADGAFVEVQVGPDAGPAVVIEMHYTSGLSARVKAGVWIATVRAFAEDVPMLPVSVAGMPSGYGVTVKVAAAKGEPVTYRRRDDADRGRRSGETINTRAT